jgi:phospholipid transport system substrate-binding protein
MAPVNALDEGLIAIMRLGRSAPFQKRFDTIAPVIDRTLDVSAILQTSIGPRWAALPDEQRMELLRLFRRFTGASYVANFNSYSGEKFEVTGEPRTVGNDVVVQTRILRTNGDPTRLDYVLRQTDGGWRIVDVLLDGTISRVAVQRSDFRSLLGRGDAGPLIASLQRKIADLSGGALAA